MALSTSCPNLNLEARILMNTEADCENNYKLTSYCLQRGPHLFGLPTDYRQIRDTAGGSPLVNLENFPRCAFQEATESTKVPFITKYWM